MKETLKIEGMRCQHCVKAVASALGAVDGVHVEAVRLGEAEVMYEPSTTPRDALVAALEEEGYAVAVCAA